MPHFETAPETAPETPPASAATKKVVVTTFVGTDVAYPEVTGFQMHADGDLTIHNGATMIGGHARGMWSHVRESD